MKKLLKFLFWIFLLIFLVVNFIAYNHAYRFTHFTDAQVELPDPENLSLSDKVEILFLGFAYPKPQNYAEPHRAYQEITLQGDQKLSGWWVQIEQHQGVILLFHGYGGCKSQLIREAELFNRMGYSTLLIDFRASGESEGNQTTIGFLESQDVITAFNWVKAKFPKEKIIPYGFSMGAVAMMKAVSEAQITPDQMIIAAPFGSLEEAVKQRFRLMDVPTFPLADMMLLYGSWQNNFNTFTHKPIDYAKNIGIPTLLMLGQKDPKVSLEETQEIYQNLSGEKKLALLKNSAHESYINHDQNTWEEVISDFLEF